MGLPKLISIERVVFDRDQYTVFNSFGKQPLYP